MEYLSINGMENIFKEWANADPNIESFGFGQFFNQNGSPKVEQKYPGMWVQLVSSTPNEYNIIRNYQIIIYDLVFDNQNKVVSDCEEIAFRLIRFIKTADEVFNVWETPNIQPFSDKFLDDVSGVIIDISIESNAISSNCSDPTYSFTIIKNNV
jgi:hypothetical protein